MSTFYDTMTISEWFHWKELNALSDYDRNLLFKVWCNIYGMVTDNAKEKV